jgi:signal transduction histidine kinase
MGSHDGEDLVQQLRRIVRQDPREARRHVQALLAGPLRERDELLARLCGVGDGRLRQCVANAAIAQPELLPTILGHLQAWLASETDEFARRSVADAVQRAGGAQRRTVQKAGLVDPALVAAYRYVSDRLAHELRNALLLPQARINVLQDLIGDLGDAKAKTEMLACLGRLADEFHDVGRLAVSDPDDEYFRFRPVTVGDWLELMGASYARRYRAIGFERLGAAAAIRAQVVANDYFLRLIFWNLWLNSHQAVGDGCKMSIEFSIDGGNLRLVVLDNGTGFPAESLGVAFYDRYSKKSPDRGRGLLEVQDAVEQLRGTAELFKHASGAYRVSLTFPVSLS